jgi:hypothetical protein
VAISLQRTIKTHPAIGWVRANQIANAQILSELNEVRKQNQELEEQVRSLTPAVENLAGLDESLELTGTYESNHYKYDWKMPLTWGELFATIGPNILECPNDAIMHTHFNVAIHELFRAKKQTAPSDWQIKDQWFQTAKIQLKALKLINVDMLQTTNNSMALFWSLTPSGESTLLQLRTLKKSPNSQ